MRREDVLALDEPREGRFVHAEFGRKRPLSQRVQGRGPASEEPFLVAKKRLPEGEERLAAERESVQKPAGFVATAPPVGAVGSVSTSLSEAAQPQAGKVVRESNPPAVLVGLDQKIRKEPDSGKASPARTGSGIEAAEKTPGVGDLVCLSPETLRQRLVPAPREVHERKLEEGDEKRARFAGEVSAPAYLCAQAVSEVEGKAAHGIESLQAMADGVELLGRGGGIAGKPGADLLGRFREVPAIVEAVEEVDGERAVALGHVETGDLFGEIRGQRRRGCDGFRRRGVPAAGSLREILGEERFLVWRGIFFAGRFPACFLRGCGLEFEERVFGDGGFDRLAQLVAVENEESQALTKACRKTQPGARCKTGAKAGQGAAAPRRGNSPRGRRAGPRDRARARRVSPRR